MEDLADMTILTKKVLEWGKEKGIDNPIMQFAKVNEEAGEIAHELTRGRTSGPELEDALGDTLVTIIILCGILGLDPGNCLQSAYDTIKGRKGKIINGSFVKEQ